MRAHNRFADALSAAARAALAAGCLLCSGAAAAEDDAWPDLREALFGDRPILDGEGIVGLDAPYRAHDAAIVPITVTAGIPQSDARYVAAVHLVIDNNPAPLAAVFRLTRRSGTAAVATRVRIDSYTTVRAIAETDDGTLYMAERFVKASGGCSAPASKDADAALAQIGRMKLRQPEAVRPGEPNEVQLLSRHPNYSGLQMDQLTRHYVPARFVREVEVSYAGEPVLSIESAISISENPSFRFSFVPDGPGEIVAVARDTDEAVFTGRWAVEPYAGI